MESGLDFILSHFSGQPLFPRSVMTKITVDLGVGQREVLDKEHAMSYFQGASWLDCRINAFALKQTNPDLLFIDLDASAFSSLKAFKAGLTKILKNIERKIGGHPSVLWSGRGYHIIQPIYCPEPLENDDRLKALDPEPSNKFLQWAERYLSLGKADDKNNPALKSCLLRIPGSKNYRCVQAGVDPEVKVLQCWDGHRPDYKLLLGRFTADLVGKKIIKEKNKKRYNNSSAIGTYSTTIPQKYQYIENRLLKTPLTDYRKLVVGIILSRYLINIKHLKYEQVYQIIWAWLDKCAQLKELEPSNSYFDRYVVKYQLEQAQKEGMLPMSENKMQSDYPELYQALKISGGA